MDIIIETPKGSNQKFKFDKEYRLFRLYKTLPASLAFPFDFGFIPNSKGEDKDPIDVMAISEFTAFPGCVIDCRIIGCIQAEQPVEGKKIRNDRFLAIPQQSVVYGSVYSIEDISVASVSAIESFFVTYTKLEGKELTLLGNLNATEATARLKSLLFSFSEYA